MSACSILIRLCPLIGLVLVSTAGQRKDTSDPERHTTVNGFLVKWKENRENDNIGDTVRIYKRRHGPPGKQHRRSIKLAYRFFDSTTVNSVAGWTIASKNRPTVRGMILTTSFSTGSGKEVIILAEVNGAIRQVFKGFSDKVLKRNPIQLVHLDGDSNPEIVIIPSYSEFRGSDPGSTRAEIWKWSTKRERYVMVRESAYADRLKPLK